MIVRNLPYVLLWLLVPLLFSFIPVSLKLNDILYKEVKKLENYLRDIDRKRDYIVSLKAFVERNKIPMLTENQAIEVLAKTLETLEENFKVKVIRSFYTEGDTLRIDVSLTLYPESRNEVAMSVGRLLTSVKPVIEIHSFKLETSGSGTVLNLKVSLVQPFLKGKGNEGKA